MTTYTLKQLQAMSPIERARLRANAARTGGPAAEAIVKLIDESGLPLSSGGMPFDHPIYQELDQLIKSEEGRKLAVKAVEEGLPAMAGIDPFLQKRMGPRYSADQQITLSAGSIVGEVMRAVGYEKDREAAPLPDGCIAKTAATWKAKQTHRR